jgi:hypothetical protein
MLAIQAHTLDTIFNELARRSSANMVEGYGEAAERYMRLALKAQSQCRTTIEALAEMKNPKPVAFVQQANIASGPQQVNNGISTPTRADTGTRAGESENAQNGLLEKQPRADPLDRGTTSTATPSHPKMATLDPIDRTPNG